MVLISGCQMMLGWYLTGGVAVNPADIEGGRPNDIRYRPGRR